MSSPEDVARETAIRAFQTNPTLLRVRAGVQHYAWGAADFIPALLGVANPDQQPFAELWMGAHPDLPAVVELAGTEVPLNQLIQRAADPVLGRQVATRFAGELPYLFKVLSAAVPLSIQAHPTKRQAEAGFARENADQVPLRARHRNYKDANHKPEILAALTEFYALRGFRPLDEIGSVLADVPELRPVTPDYQPTPAGLKTLYERLMTWNQDQVDAVLGPLVSRLAAADSETPFRLADREYWFLEADRQFSRDGHHDPGLFSVYLLNLVHLRPGEAVYLSAGVLHAYLRGAGMELMANSNNVLRGGLTPKHVDVPELLANVTFEGGPAEVIQPTRESDGPELVYRTPAPEFELRRIELLPGQPFHSRAACGADMIILTDSDNTTPVALHAAGDPLQLSRGDVCLAPCGVDFSLQSNAPATLFRATVPAAGE